MVRWLSGPTWIPTVTFTFDVSCLEAARKPRGKSAQEQRARHVRPYGRIVIDLRQINSQNEKPC